MTAIETEALHLPVQARAKLAQLLLESLDSLTETETEELWLDESERRASEIDTGAVSLVSSDELEQRIRARFK